MNTTNAVAWMLTVLSATHSVEYRRSFLSFEDAVFESNAITRRWRWAGSDGGRVVSIVAVPWRFVS